ncbi:MAG TPA: L-threonylcarbamoyladenylate synthase [Anaerolineaceae bacterium]
MKTEIRPMHDPQAVTRALEMFLLGEIVAFPTDTVYGLGTAAFSAAGIERLFAAKGRDTNKAIAVLLGGVDQLEQVTVGLSENARRLAESFWPGALTLVVTRHPDLPEVISPLPTVGVRIPNHAALLAMLRRSGPLATTSANQAGKENPHTAQDVVAQLDGQMALVLDGGRTPGGFPSTVVDCTSEQIRVLREGPITAAMIQDILRSGK